MGHILPCQSIVQGSRVKNIRKCCTANFIFCANFAPFISISFTYTIDESYGIFVNGVNGVNGSNENHTYWELLSKKGNTITPLSVGKCTSLITQHTLCHRVWVQICWSNFFFWFHFIYNTNIDFSLNLLQELAATYPRKMKISLWISPVGPKRRFSFFCGHIYGYKWDFSDSDSSILIPYYINLVSVFCTNLVCINLIIILYQSNNNKVTNGTEICLISFHNCN